MSIQRTLVSWCCTVRNFFYFVLNIWSFEPPYNDISKMMALTFCVELLGRKLIIFQEKIIIESVKFAEDDDHDDYDGEE